MMLTFSKRKAGEQTRNVSHSNHTAPNHTTHVQKGME